MNADYNIFFDEEKRFVRITKGIYGVLYIVKEDLIDLNDSFAFECSDTGRCVAVDNIEKEIDLTSFDVKLREFAKKNNFSVIDRK